MAQIYRVTATWSGFQGAPGYSKFCFSDLTTDAARNAAGAAVKAYFTAYAPYMLTSWSVLVSPTVQEYNVGTGTLDAEATMTTPPTSQVGSAALAAFAGGSGLCCTWRTGTIYAGRRVIGRTFMVPGVGVFENDGTIQTVARGAVEAAGNALVAAASCELAIWAKSWSVGVDGKPVQTGGQVAPVTSATVKDMASQLRSRRL